MRRHSHGLYVICVWLLFSTSLLIASEDPTLEQAPPDTHGADIKTQQETQSLLDSVKESIYTETASSQGIDTTSQSTPPNLEPSVDTINSQDVSTAKEPETQSSIGKVKSTEPLKVEPSTTDVISTEISDVSTTDPVLIESTSQQDDSSVTTQQESATLEATKVEDKAAVTETAEQILNASAEVIGSPGISEKPDETPKDVVEDSKVLEDATKSEGTDTEAKSEEGKEQEKKDDFPVYSEWTEKVKAAEEKNKQEVQATASSASKPKIRMNFASRECGAKILASNPETENAKSVLNANKDDYMINPCSAKKWFVVELCEPLQVKSVELASLELFSSMPKSFRIGLSDRYPTKEWLGSNIYNISEERTIQVLSAPSVDLFTKYIKVEMLEHYGNEHFCPLTLFRVYGIPLEDEDDDGNDSHTTDTDSDLDETVLLHDDENISDKEQPKNLFASARDTVIKIVKTVLSVDDTNNKDGNVQNGTSLNNSVAEKEANNATKDGELLPCVSGTEIPANTDIVADKNLAVSPIINASESLVIKLEDHEQAPSEQLKWNYGGQHLLFLDSGNIIDIWTRIVLYCLSERCNATKEKYQSKIPSSFCAYFGALMRHEAIYSCVDPSPRPSFLAVPKESSTNQQVNDTLASADEHPKESDVVPDKTETSASIVEATLPDTRTSSSQTLDQTSEIKGIPVESELIEESSKEIDSVVAELSTAAPETTTSSPQTSTGISLEPSSPVIKSPLQEDDSKTSTPLLHLQDTTLAPLPENIRTISSTVGVEDSSSLSESELTDGTKLHLEFPSTKASSESSSSVITESIEPQGPGITEANKAEIQEVTKIIDMQNTSKPVEPSPAHIHSIRVPSLPSLKKESSLMRLTNRLKALEYNVSLSNRFLEELSQRFKKQSEEIMNKMNTTIKRLNEVSKTSDDRFQLTQERLDILEKRVDNLTDFVLQLEDKVDNLCRQLTEKQLVWTSLEVVFVIIFFFLSIRRSKVSIDKESLSKEVANHIRKNHLRRRNSDSITIVSGSPHKFLQKHSSDTRLDAGFTEYRTISQRDSGFQAQAQAKELPKKKKKRKSRVFESKSSSTLGYHFDQPPGRTSKSQINSAGVLFGAGSNEECSVKSSEESCGPQDSLQRSPSMSKLSSVMNGNLKKGSSDSSKVPHVKQKLFSSVGRGASGGIPERPPIGGKHKPKGSDTKASIQGTKGATNKHDDGIDSGRGSVESLQSVRTYKSKGFLKKILGFK